MWDDKRYLEDFHPLNHSLVETMPKRYMIKMAYPNSIKSTGLVWTENDDKTQNDRDI
jgi:hypothetical protein